jgi:hypothetical protein
MGTSALYGLEVLGRTARLMNEALRAGESDKQLEQHFLEFAQRVQRSAGRRNCDNLRTSQPGIRGVPEVWTPITGLSNSSDQAR